MGPLSLPPRSDEQPRLARALRLSEFALARAAHLDTIEYVRRVGVPYASLARALNSVGFEAVCVTTLQTPVCRARHGTCKKAAKAAAARGIGQIGRIYMGQRLKDRAELERKFGRLQWPSPPGERGPRA